MEANGTPVQLRYREDTTHIYVLCGCGRQFHEYGKDASAHYREWRENHLCSLKPTTSAQGDGAGE